MSAQAPPKVRYLRVTDAADGQRIDNFLLRTLKGVPRSHIYRLLRRGEVRVNRGRVRPDHRLRAGDEVRVPPVEAPSVPPRPAPGSGARALMERIVLYEDDALLVLDKPCGMAVHGGSGISLGLIEMLRATRPDAPYLELAHRLDRETSGCLAVAKRRSVLRRLHEALRAQRVGKEYLCLVRGAWRGARRIDAPLRRDVQRSGERVVRIDDAEGRSATTFFVPIDRWADGDWSATLLGVRLATGRTHQIRVHAAEAGHPLAGDDKYGDREFNRRLRALGLRRLYLHAVRLILPKEVTGGGRLEVYAPLPADLAALARRLGLEVPDPPRW